MLGYYLSALELKGKQADPVAGVVNDFLVRSFSDQFVDGVIN